MVLEVELEVGVLLNSTKDLNSVSDSSNVSELRCSYLHTLSGDLSLGETCQYMLCCQWALLGQLYLRTAVVTYQLLAGIFKHL